MKLTRRESLWIGLGGVAAAVLPIGASAATVEELTAAFTGGATPGTGGITLSAPEIAENGNTVPVEVTIEGEMTADSYVTDVLILADGNPSPGVATFHFSPLSGEARASTRIRLAKTQNVVAVARMNDGSLYIDRREVKVTIGGCGG